MVKNSATSYLTVQAKNIFRAQYARVLYGSYFFWLIANFTSMTRVAGTALKGDVMLLYDTGALVLSYARPT